MEEATERFVNFITFYCNFILDTIMISAIDFEYITISK